MHTYFDSQHHPARWLWRLIFWTALAIMLLLLSYTVASAQCVPNPTNETAVGLKNASSYYLTFYIDGERKEGVPPGDRSVDYVVTHGEHTLLAEAVIAGETVSASRTADIPEGYVCTWTVTDAPVDEATEYEDGSKSQASKSELVSAPLGRHRPQVR